MTTEIALRYLHFLAVFVIFATLSCEHLLLKREISRADVVRLARIDAAYGIAAGVLLAAGLTLWLGGIGKPTAFYSGNPVFHAKVGLFLLIGLMSIAPTVFFLRERKGAPEDRIAVPGYLIWLLRLELLILLVLPLLAGLMARGVGLRA